ncbi:hypothetical protein ACFE04_025362 [Oxalis oulophora]
MSTERILRRSPRTQLQSSAPATDNSHHNKKKKLKTLTTTPIRKFDEPTLSFFVGDPVPEDEAMQRWPWRFQSMHHNVKQNKIWRSNSRDADEDDDVLVMNLKCHYARAEVDKVVFNLGDCAFVKGEEKGHNYIGRIIEFFQTLDDEDYMRVQWFYRAEDTVMKQEAASHDKKRVFYSEVMNDNLLECIVKKLKVIHLPPNVGLKSKSIPSFDFYYNMKYSIDYSTFSTMADDGSNSYASFGAKKIHVTSYKPMWDAISSQKSNASELVLLDLFSGCGGMSTGLCLGAKAAGLNLVTKWALDMDTHACKSLKLNHPETQIRNESAEDFLDLVKAWDKLCEKYLVKEDLQTSKPLKSEDIDKVPPGEFEVERLIDICFGDPTDTGKCGLKFQVRWMGYGPSEDTWEPIEELKPQSKNPTTSSMLILPEGGVDIICGGPPCQGISGYNRHRNVDNPLDDERNRQIVIFMDIVNFLNPRYALMENVTDILKFASACLGRYALSRLVKMNYQARLGIMAAGCYGLPQFRLRVFLWAAQCNEILPQFPLPTHDVILRYGAPVEFERNVVAYDETQTRDLEKSLFLRDAISDLPLVSNDETREEMLLRKPPETEFQKYIRASKCEMMGITSEVNTKATNTELFDHRPLPLPEDDYLRVCRIPQKKGANYRDLPGVVVGGDNVARRDPKSDVTLPSGKPLVPDYALQLEQGKSVRPFGRVWWDETVPTVLCAPNPRCQAVLHPEQDRVFTIRESARLQGFHDYYKFSGALKDRYRQVGNAVAIPVGRALGYALSMAVKKQAGDEPLMTLPPKFSLSTTVELYALGMAVKKQAGDEPLMTLPPKFSLSTTVELYALGMAVKKQAGDEPLMTLPPKFSLSTTVELLEQSTPCDQMSLEGETKTYNLI